MNRQDVFNTVATHLLTQGKQARSAYKDQYGIGHEEACAYRGSEGTKCAAGVLIKDEHYSAELEGSNIHNPAVQQALSASLGYAIATDDIIFIGAMQLIHDGYPVEMWPDELRRVAANYNLELPEAVFAAEAA